MSVSDDPFASSSGAPSLSWKDLPVGSWFQGTVVEAPELVQSRNFETNEPDYWPARNGQAPDPKMAVVFGLMVSASSSGTAVGEQRSVWAVKPSALFAAISAVTSQQGRKLVVGDSMVIIFSSEKPNDNPKLNAAKQYEVRVTPGDPFAGQAAAAVTPPPAAPAAAVVPPPAAAAVPPPAPAPSAANPPTAPPDWAVVTPPPAPPAAPAAPAAPVVDDATRAAAFAALTPEQQAALAALQS